MTKAKSQGQLDYEKDVAQRPLYHDKTPRKTWDQLSEAAKYSWERPSVDTARKA